MKILFLAAAVAFAQHLSWAQTLADSVVLFNRDKIIFAKTYQATTDIKSIKNFLKKEKNVLKDGYWAFGSHRQQWQIFNSNGQKLLDSAQAIPMGVKNFFAVKKNDNYGFVSCENFRAITPFVYETYKTDGDILLAKPQKKIQLTNVAFEPLQTWYVAECEYLNYQTFKYRIGKKWGLITESGAKITAPVYDNILLFYDTLYLTEWQNKFGVITKGGRTILPAEYKSVAHDTLNFLRITKPYAGNIAHGVCNTTGRIIIPPIYTQIGAFTEGLYPVESEQKWGYINTEGEKIIPFFYDYAGNFKNGYAIVKRNNTYGIIDKNSNWVKFPEYKYIDQVNDSVWIWRKEYESGLFIPATKRSITLAYQSLHSLDGGYIAYEVNGKFGLLSPKMAPLLKPEWDAIYTFPAEQIIITEKNKYYSIYYLNGNLKVFMNYPFTRFEPYQESMALVVHKGKTGFMNNDGLLLVSTQYDEARNFKNGCAAVRIGKKWGFVDKKENFVAHPHYEAVGDFALYAAPVMYSSRWGFINRIGKEVTAPQYDAYKLLPSQRFFVKYEKRWGLVDTNGVEIINPIYHDLEELNPLVYKVRMNNYYGLVNTRNKPLKNFEYDNIAYIKERNWFMFTSQKEWQAIQ